MAETDRERTVREALRDCDATMETVSGCTDRFCYLTGPGKGQVTNGGCRCVPDFQVRKVLMTLHRLRSTIAASKTGKD